MALDVIALAMAPRLIETQPAPLLAAADLQRADVLTLGQKPGPLLPRIGAYAWRGTTQKELARSQRPSTATPRDGRHILVIASTRTSPAWQAPAI
ncbi:hypothetical protein [Nonomuraea turcica]|uniref:hypothetical protein n=1 Tax=Nonomuraea sp. G32 TaxID=3067274 RepID=UPI00273BBB71|nr:hypothetical protein [Nonomuraea sp. G32]MDP4506937.1 hypothetical protein [Nonomuraea sp. G32]